MSNQKELPQDKGLDHTISFLKEGYLYITNRRECFNSDMFITRLLGDKEVVCIG